MDPKFYYFLHVFSIILLTGFTFASVAGKKKAAIITGILSVVSLVAAVGLMHKIGHSWGQAWVIIKIAAWLFVSALGAMAYKKSKSFVYSGLIIAVGAALYSVYVLRF